MDKVKPEDGTKRDSNAPQPIAMTPARPNPISLSWDDSARIANSVPQSATRFVPMFLKPTIWQFPDILMPSNTPDLVQVSPGSYFSPNSPYVWGNSTLDVGSARENNPMKCKPETQHASSENPDIVRDVVKTLLDDESTPVKTVDEHRMRLGNLSLRSTSSATKSQPRTRNDTHQPDLRPHEPKKASSSWSDVVKTRRDSGVPKSSLGSNTAQVDDEVLLWNPRPASEPYERTSDKKSLVTPAPPAGSERKARGEDKRSKAPHPNFQHQHENKSDSNGRPYITLPEPMPAFFGPANDTPLSIVVGHPIPRFFTTEQRLQDRLSKLKAVANRGYGVVPITNSFTMRNAQTRHVEKKILPEQPKPQLELTPPSSPETDESDDHLIDDIITTPIRKQSTKNHAPPSPRIPTDDELKTKDLVLYQVGFPSGRQGLFQGVSMSHYGEDISDLVGQFVVLTQDDGLDIGLLRGFEKIDQLTPRIPEIPFMRVMRKAHAKEIARLEFKAREEAHMVQTAHNLLKHRPGLQFLKVTYCEFQFDRNKLVVYADMTQWVNFNEFVKSLHASCETDFGYQARIFIQRRFLGGSSQQ